ncbi:PqqD family protein (plasmid) [Bacillus mycoides]|uniref:PqqD family protein n=1 Tax=Bacillus TaxID=1386 RepID=UPI0002799C35|nr:MULTISPECIES: PqqD family protein [Bacillus]EJR95137.1 hypothetical protein IKO_05742 [Bacillus cereus VDM034]MDI6535240.1 PqqD family protein [Bacillus mycoides]QWI25332.1 PqqD family protein [Bacillus mycoides]RAN66322.1 PqqD family protein [Bacillus sp. SRB_8]WJE61400.1 PqqD family protein [Bacillus mycoides]
MKKKIYILKKDIFFDKNPEGIFILSPKGETLILDDEVAMVIWKEFNENSHLTNENLVGKLLIDFNLDVTFKERVENDVTRFFAELLNHGLIEEREYELHESIH